MSTIAPLQPSPAQVISERCAACTLVWQLLGYLLCVRSMQDALGHPIAPDAALTRSLAKAYTALTAVLSGLKAGHRRESPLVRGGSQHQQQQPHVHWRDSALTRFLRGSLAVSERIMVLGTVAAGPEVGALHGLQGTQPAGGRRSPEPCLNEAPSHPCPGQHGLGLAAQLTAALFALVERH